MNTNLNNVAESALLVSQTAHQWTARKFDRRATKDLNDREGAQDGAARVNKALVEADAIRPLQKLFRAAREFHYMNTLPWDDRGPRILTNNNFFEYEKGHNRFAADIEAEARKFALQYPTLRENARRMLGAMFNEDDYPPTSDIESRFIIEVSYLPIPDPADFRVRLGGVKEDEIRASIERRMEETVNNAMAHLWKELHGVVNHVVDRLSDAEDGEAKKFHATLIDNLRRVVDVTPRLNLTGDEDLQRFVDMAKSKLASVDVNTLRANHRSFDPKAKAEALAAAEQIAKQMKGYMGNLS